MINKIDTSRDAVKKTGKAFLIAFSIVAMFIFLKHAHVEGWTNWSWAEGVAALWWKVFLIAGIVISVLSRAAYPVMKPFHVAWMTFAHLLAWLNTRILLGVFFYLIVTPTGLLMRVFGKDLLDEKIDKSAQSYWKKRDRKAFNPKHADRMF